MHAIIELYDGGEITFRPDGWVNATEACKRFGKRAPHFLELPGTKAYIAALAKSMKASPDNPDLVHVQHGGAKPGTWLHPELGIELARWLSPDFAVWCNQQIRRILAGGQATTPAPELVSLVQAVAGISEGMGKFVVLVDRLVTVQEDIITRLTALERRPAAPVPAPVPLYLDRPGRRPGEHEAVAAVLRQALGIDRQMVQVSSATLADICHRLGNLPYWTEADSPEQRTKKFCAHLRAYTGRWMDGAGATRYFVQCGRVATHRLYFIRREPIPTQEVAP